MKKITLYVLLPLFLFAASYDCKNAKTKIEITICKDKKLSSLDSGLNEYYKTIIKDTKQHSIYKNDRQKIVDYFKKIQKTWLKNRNYYCSKFNSSELKKCLTEYYLLQIKRLKPYAVDKYELYAPYANLLYKENIFTKIPYELEEMVSEEKFNKIKLDHKKWENSILIKCKNIYGLLNKKCLKKANNEKKLYYLKMLKRLDSHAVILSEKKQLEISKYFNTVLAKYQDNTICIHKEYIPENELNTLLKKPFVKTINNTDFLPKNYKTIKTFKDRDCDRINTKFWYSYKENIYYMNKNIISIIKEISSFDGGLHGDYDFHFINIDRNKGDIIKFDDVFNSKINSFLLKEYYSISNLYNITEKKFIDLCKKRFYFAPEGIKIKFNDYDIGPYGDAPTILIPKEIIKKLIPAEKFSYYFSSIKQKKE